MPQVSDVHIDTPLTNFAVKLGVGGGFAADDIFPLIPVKKDSDKFFIFSRDEELSDDFETIASDRDLANEIDWSVTDDTYSADSHRLRHFVSDKIMRNADSPIRPLQIATAVLVGKLRLGLEKRVETLVTDTSAITDVTPGTKWDATSGVDIEGDIDFGKETMAVACGMEPNIIVLPPDIAKVVKKDPTVRDLIKFTQNDLLVNGDLPPTIWNMKVIIPGSLQNSANAGQTPNIGRVWDSGHVGLYWVDPNPGIETASVGYQFSPSSTPRFQVSRYTEPGRRGQWVEVSLTNAEKITSVECAFLVSNALT